MDCDIYIYIKTNYAKEDLFTNTILFSDILKLESPMPFYEEVTEKRNVMIKTLEDK